MLLSMTDILPQVAQPQGVGADAGKRPYKPERFELGYEVEGLHPCIDEAHKATQWWLNDIIHKQRERSRWVTLYGQSGSGKTHLATAAARVLREHGHRVQKWRWGRALGMMLDGEWELMGQLCRLPVLVLDDVGAEYTGGDKSRQLNAAKLLELLEARLGKWTFITTNLRPKQIGEELDARISSRLYRGQNVLVDMSFPECDYCLNRHKAAREKGGNV